MAEPVIVPIQLEVTDIDMSGLNLKDVQKDISTKMSAIKKSIQDAFSGIDASAINKPIESAMTSVKKSVQAAEDAYAKYNQALLRAASSTEEYRNAVSNIDNEIKSLNEELARYQAMGMNPKSFAIIEKEFRKRIDALKAQKGSVNPADYMDYAAPIELEKVANAYKKVLSAQETVNKKSEEFNQTIQDNKLTDEYAEMVKQAEAYKKKLEDLNAKSKKMQTLGATDKQWESLRYDTDKVSTAMDDLIKKMRLAVNTGEAFRFGEGNKGELSSQIKSLSMSGRNHKGAINLRADQSQSPYTEDYTKALDSLDSLEKKATALKAKTAKMIELGASEKQLEGVIYDAQQLDAQVNEVKQSLTDMVVSGKAFRFGKGDDIAELQKIEDKSKALNSSLSKTSKDAKIAQGGLTKLGETHPKLAKIVGFALKIGKNFVIAAKQAKQVGVAIGKIVSASARMAKGIYGGIKNIKSLGKSGRTTSSDMSKGFHKLTRNIMMFGLGFRTAYYMIKRLRTIFIDSFKLMGETFDEIGNPMKEFIQSFNRLKGSIATAFQPIVSVVMPILTKLMNYLSGVLEAIGKFNAVLTGQGHIYKTVAKDVNSVSAAAKNANKQLGAYDKLEVIQDNNLGYDYEKQEIGETESAASNFAQMVKKAWENADFTGVGQYVTEKLVKVLANVEQNIVPKITGFVNRLVMSANTFLLGFDANLIGSSVGSIINTAISGIDWATLGSLFANIQNTVWRFVGGLVTTINWTELGTSISTGLLSLITTLDFASYANMISGLIIGIVNMVSAIDWASIAEKLLAGIQTVLTGVGTALSSSDNPMLSAFGDIILALNDAITLLKPAIESIIQAIGPIIQSILPLISTLLPPIAEIISEAVQIVMPVLVSLFESIMPIITDLVMAILPVILNVMNALKPIFEVITNTVLPVIVNLLNTLMPVIESVLGLVSDLLVPIGNIIALVMELGWSLIAPFITLLQPIVEILVNICGVLGDVLGPVLESIIAILSGIKDKIKGPVNAVIDIIESFVNKLINGINAGIRALNKISFDIPDWIPGIGGRKFGFNLKELSAVNIPRLAQGAVIPPNKEFLAVLGDQKNGTNIEAPLDTIKQALAEVLAEVGGGTREPIVLEVNGRVLAKVVWDEQEKRYKQTGKYSMA